MVFTYDLSSDVGKVRLMVPDRVEAEAIFTDEEIAGLLAVEGSVKLAVALALETIAADEALVGKVIRVGNLSTDGAKTADALLKRAAALRSQVATATADEEAADSPFEIAEMVTGPFSYRERLANQVLRGEAG